MQKIDMEAQPTERFLKALVYGKSGTGKTNFGVTAPKPLILLSESQGVPHIRAAAKRLGVPMPAVIFMETLDDYRNVLRAIHGDKAQPFVVRDGEGNEILRLAEWPITVVLDSVTDACSLVSDEIRRQSPQRTGKDGLPVDSERYWNVLSDRASKLIRSYRDAPLNVLFLCLLSEKETGEGEEKKRWIGPQFPMKSLPGVVMAAVNVVGVTYRKRSAELDPKTKERFMVYGIATTGPDFMELKPFPPLRNNEVTDFASWCNRINGIDDGSKAPEAPDGDGVGMAEIVPADVAKPAIAAPVDAPAKSEPADAAVPDAAPKSSTRKTAKVEALATPDVVPAEVRS